MLTIGGDWTETLYVVILLIVTLVILVFVTQIIWNNTMTKVFNLPLIGWWETLGLIILSNIFFGPKTSGICK